MTLNIFVKKGDSQFIVGYTYSSKGSATRNHSCFVEFHGIRVEIGDKSMAGFMDGCVQSVFLTHAQLFAFDAHHNPIPGELKISRVGFLPAHRRKVLIRFAKIFFQAFYE